MAEKQIVWSPRANEEFKSILEFYLDRNESNSYSLKLLNAVDSLLILIKEHNNLGRLSSNKTTRVLPFESFLLFYEIEEQKIHVMSIWDNRQNPKFRLEH